MAADVSLRVPTLEHLAQYTAALRRAWWPDNSRGPEAADEELARIAGDPHGYIAKHIDREAAGDPVKLPDGTLVPRIPGVRYWIWDGEFCGVMNLRWQRGSAELPPHVLGHIGYSVVPWKRGRGIATRALALVLPEARAEGLAYVELTTDPENIASQKVILANAGVCLGPFTKPAQFGHRPGLKYRIALA